MKTSYSSPECFFYTQYQIVIVLRLSNSHQLDSLSPSGSQQVVPSPVLAIQYKVLLLSPILHYKEQGDFHSFLTLAVALWDSTSNSRLKASYWDNSRVRRGVLLFLITRGRARGWSVRSISLWPWRSTVTVHVHIVLSIEDQLQLIKVHKNNSIIQRLITFGTKSIVDIGCTRHTESTISHFSINWYQLLNEEGFDQVALTTKTDQMSL